MKRQNNLYEKIYNMDNLRFAYKNAKHNKSWYKEIKEIEKNPNMYFKKLQLMFINHTYKTSDYIQFIKKEKTKERVIYKLPFFPDRIAQWAILQIIEPYLIKNLIQDTYSAIPNRGIHYGLYCITQDIKNNQDNCKYCLKLDIHHYYQSIDHQILKDKFARLFKDKELLWVLNEIIDSISTSDENIEGKGIPIGNYLSQYSGNLYLSSFDHWCKETLHIKYYYRYMDDIVILDKDKTHLFEIKNEINQYLVNNLKLQMKNNYQIFPTYIRGVDFLGYRIFDDYILLRKSTYKNMRKKMLEIRKKCSNGGKLTYSEWCSINAYQGWLIHCNGYRLYRKYIYPLRGYSNLYYYKYIKNKKGAIKYD